VPLLMARPAKKAGIMIYCNILNFGSYGVSCMNAGFENTLNATISINSREMNVFKYILVIPQTPF